MNEMVLGLTDRVVRSYRWISNRHKTSSLNLNENNLDELYPNENIGKFVALNKWECANQIGSITLHHSWDGKPSLLIAQPGGTFMRIKCQTDDSISQHSTSSRYNETFFEINLNKCFRIFVLVRKVKQFQVQ